MRARSALLFTTLFAAAPVLAPSLGAQGVQYAPGTTSYRVTTTTHGTQSSPMGKQDFDIGVNQRLTVNVTRQSTDTLVATVTIDSISVTSTGPTPDVSRFQGTTFTSYLSPTGRVYASKAPVGSDPLLAQLGESILHFLPHYHSDLRPGLTWSDTTAGKVTQQGLDVDRTIVADYTVAGDTVVDGVKVIRVKRHTAMKAAGAGSPGGNAVSLQSATTGDTNFFVTPAGAFLGSDSNDDIRLKLTITAQNAEINVTQKAVQTVRAIH